jgi:hypothetical protein
MKLIFKVALIILVLVSYSNNCFSAVFQSNTASGNWNSSGSWLRISGVIDADGIPDETDTLTILNGHTINVPSGYTARFMDLTTQSTGVINLVSGCGFRFWSTSQYEDGSAFPSAVRIVKLDHSGSFTGTTQIIFDSKTILTGNGDFSSGISFRGTNTVTLRSCSFNFIGAFSMLSGGDLIIENTSSPVFTGSLISYSSVSIIENHGTVTFNSSSVFTNISPTTVFKNFSGSTVNYAATSASTGDFPIPLTGYYSLNISGTASCDGDFDVYENWSNTGVFTSSNSGNIITFSGSSAQTISGNGTNNFKNLTLNNSNGLTLSGGTVNIEELMLSSSGTFTQNGSTVILKSSSSNKAGMIKISSASDYSYSSGSFTSERFFNGSEGWRLISSPIEGSTLADVDDEFIFCGITDGSAGNNYSYIGCGGFYSVLTYNPSSDDFTEVTSVSQSISGGSGTFIYSAAGATNLSITNSGSNGPEFDDISKSVTANKFNLTSNPYPATLDWSATATASPNINGTYYKYSGTGDASGWSTSTADIATNQGFMISSTGGTAVNFSISRTTSSQATFIKSTNGVNRPLILKISSLDSSTSYEDHAYVFADHRFSSNYDTTFEVPKLFSPYPENVTNLFFIDDDSNYLDRIYINNNQNEDLNLDLKTGINAQGSYKINFSNLPEFMIGSCITLEDMHNGVMTDLRTDSIYLFSSDSLATSPRFKLHINIDYDINVSNLSCFQDSSGIISLTGPSIQGSYFNLIDSNGSVIDSIFANQDSVVFDDFSAGVYNVATNNSGSCSMINQNIVVLEPEEVVASFLTFVDTVYLDTNGVAIVNFKNLSTGGTNYNWDFGDGTHSTQKNPNHIFNTTGLFDVKLTVDNDSIGKCSDIFEKSIVIINPFLDIKYISDSYFSLRCHRNYLYVDSQLKTFKSYSIINLEGKELRFGKISDFPFQINIPDLKTGLYVISFHDYESNFFNKRFVKYD